MNMLASQQLKDVAARADNLVGTNGVRVLVVYGRGANFQQWYAQQIGTISDPVDVAMAEAVLRRLGSTNGRILEIATIQYQERILLFKVTVNLKVRLELVDA